MSCLDLLRQQACDMREESNAASQKYKKSVERGFATTVEEGWELLSQINRSKRMRMHRKYLMMCNGNPLPSREIGANMLIYNGPATGLQFAGTPYQRAMGSIQHGFRAPRAPTVTQQRPHSQQQRPLMPQQQTLSSSSGQWTGLSVPQGVNVQQQNATGLLPRPHMPNSGAHLQHPVTQLTRTGQREMSTQQQNLAGNGHGRRTNTNAMPNCITLQRGRSGQQQPVQHAGAPFVASGQTRTPIERQFTGTRNTFTSPYANSGSHTSVFHTPAATPVGMRNYGQYASGSMRLQRFTAGNSPLQPRNVYERTPHQGTLNVGSFNQPASKSMNASTGHQAMSQNDTYTVQPPQLGIDASDFFSLSEQELDEVLASLADPQPASQQKMPTSNGETHWHIARQAGSQSSAPDDGVLHTPFNKFYFRS